MQFDAPTLARLGHATLAQATGLAAWVRLVAVLLAMATMLGFAPAQAGERSAGSGDSARRISEGRGGFGVTPDAQLSDPRPCGPGTGYGPGPCGRGGPGSGRARHGHDWGRDWGYDDWGHPYPYPLVPPRGHPGYGYPGVGRPRGQAPGQGGGWNEILGNPALDVPGLRPRGQYPDRLRR